MATILRFRPRPSSSPSRDLLVDADMDGGAGAEGDFDTPSSATNTHSETVSERGEIVLFTGVRYSRWDDNAHGSQLNALEAGPAE